jgi:hypothetical protein
MMARKANIARSRRREVDGQFHHPPKSIERQSEDSFPASDPPSFSGGNIVGAPEERKTNVSDAKDGTANRKRES